MGEIAYTVAWGSSMSGEKAAAADADADLISRFLKGDRSAFDALFVKYQDYVYNIVYGIVGRAEEARDITQEVFDQAFRSLHTFRGGARFATWIYRIAVNRAVDGARAAKGRRWLPFIETLKATPDPSDSPEQVLDRHSERDMVQAALNKVPLQHRDVLVLRYFQDLSVEEIAEVLGCSVTAAKVRLHRARNHFKETYVATYGQESGAVESLS